MGQVYRALVAFPIATFTLTVVSDIVFLQTSNLLWLHFSEWLLFAGLVVGVVAAIYLDIICLVWRSRPLRRVHPPRSDRVEKAIWPDYALSSHVAARGLAFTNGSAMPEAYRDGAFVGNRGSWNRNAFKGYKVICVPFVDGKPPVQARDVVTGVMEGDEARGHPVGLSMDGTGALLIADDAGNTVWRVSSTDGTATPEPIPTDRVTADLAETGEAAQPAAPGEPGSTATSQTDVPNAVLPEDGAPAPQAEQLSDSRAAMVGRFSVLSVSQPWCRPPPVVACVSVYRTCV
jgi:hypothetical protein